MADNQQCPNCNAVIHWSQEICLKCRHHVGVPNQRELNQPLEVHELERRYLAAKTDALQQGITEQKIADFEQQINKHSKAVVNLSAQLLNDFLSGSNHLYSNYNLQTQSETRQVAEMKNDKQRSGVEAQLFGAYKTKIRYAALALEDKGLISYGNCSMSLANITMENSATVLEENSFDFVSKYRLVPGNDTPAGFRATWTQRYRLASAKLATKLLNNKPFSDLLLSSDGDRNNDQFMEVHIYGAFDNQSVTAVSVPTDSNIKDPIDRLIVKQIHAYAKQSNISCTEYD
jgi:hypothetical protein